jgi:hypothetical protein
VATEPELLSTTAFVRVRRPGNTWVNWNRRLGGGPLLTIRPGVIELSAPQGTLLESRGITVSSEASTVRRATIGWAGAPFGRRECIRISGSDERGEIEVAVSPEAGLDATWQALSAAGFRDWVRSITAAEPAIRDT